MNNKRLPVFLVAQGVVTAILINFFLMGKLYPIPKGTSDAGLIGALGVLVILIVMACSTWLYIKLSRNSKTKKQGCSLSFG